MNFTKFEEALQDILHNLEDISGDSNPLFQRELKKSVERLTKCLRFTATSGKKLRALMVVEIFNACVPDASEEQLFLARVLGWILELLHAAYCIADDIMDRSESRHGKKCWYLEINSDAMAINDSFALEHLAFEVLKKYFSSHPCYGKMLELLLNCTYKTILGQSMDLNAESKKNPSDFDEELYWSIVTYKTAYYTVFLPVSLGVALAEGYNQEVGNKILEEKIKSAALKIGSLYQVQDDALDVFGDEEKVGKKMYQDIRSGKCTWLFIQAKQASNAEQLEILNKNYGSPCKEKVDRIIELYKNLEMYEKFEKYRDDCVTSIMNDIDKIDYPELQHVLEKFFRHMISRKF